MKAFQKFSLLLALALTFNLRAATNDVAAFSGTVVDPQGNPVAGATVVCYQYPPSMGFGSMEMKETQHATTDAQGRFEFPTFDGMGIVLATRDGFAPGWRTWYAAPMEPQKIILGAPSTLAGVVVDDAGQPVADAEVLVASALNKTLTNMGQPNFLSGQIVRKLFSTRTSADGKFRIENFPADAQAAFIVKKNGKALRQSLNPFRYDELPYHGGQEDITLTLEPAGSVTGKVVARGTGQPLAGAVIGLQPATRTWFLLFGLGTTLSAADGSFQIPDVPAGSYKVMATFTNEPMPDWVVDSVPVTVATGETVSGVQLQAYKGGVLEVTVQEKANQKPIADANVSVNSEDYSRSSLTGTNGVASFRLPPGPFYLFAIKQGWAQARSQTKVTDGQTASVTMELIPPFKISGTVRDASGAPVAGAVITMFPNYGGMDMGAKTDAKGHYDLSWEKPNWWGGMSQQTFYLMARQSDRKLAVMHEIDETTTNLDLTLEPAMSLSGNLQGSDGKPVTNALVFVSLHTENSSFSISRQPVYSDEQGRLHVDALPRGQRYGFYVSSAHGYGSGQEQMDAADPKADHYDFSPLVLKLADRKLAGRVLGTNGEPAAGVQVWMHGEGQPNGNAFTDADGRFVFDAVCEGAVSVSANYNGISGSAEAMGGNTNLTIHLNARDRVYMAAPQTLTGTVSDASGNPADGALVVVTPSFGPVNVAKTDSRGQYSINWQAEPGMRDTKYFVIARDTTRNLAAIEPVRTNQTDITLRLGPAFFISGTVQDAKGAPLTQANINLNIMAGNMGGMVEYGRIKVGSDGAFTIPALPVAQQYILYISANGYGSARKSIGKTQSRTNSLQLAPFKLKTADLQLAGKVLDSGDKPMAGVHVNINGNGQPSGNTTTDATGHFRFKVCDGPVEIFAWAPSGSGRNDSGSTYARGGETNVVVKMGVRQQPQMLAREFPLKPQLWTLSALVTWPANHKMAAMILLALQAAILLGTGAGIFWLTRGRRES